MIANFKRKASPTSTSTTKMPPLVALAFSPALMNQPLPGMSALVHYQRTTNVLLRLSPTKRVRLNSSSDWISPAITTPLVPIEPIVPAKRRKQIVAITDYRFKKRFERIKQIAKGGFGTIIKALDRQTQTSVIVKSFLIKNVCEWTDDIPTEIDILMTLNHKNISPMLDAFQSGNNYRITMPNTNGMDLVKYDVPDDINLLVPSFRYVVREVAQALRYLHEDCSIVHLDIKLENVIISKKGEDEYLVQLIDFGCARRYSKGNKKFKVNGGTDLYACKEWYTRTRIVGPEADIFSLGVFVHLMIFDKEPFETVEQIMLEDEVVLPEILNAPENSGIRELLENTLVKNPSDRWDINRVLSSDWMRQKDFELNCWFPSSYFDE